MIGFGWDFYGFFVAALVFLTSYFVWAFYAARRDGDRKGGGR